jgi:hypothetical protein
MTDEANYVRTALMIANDTLYRGENKNQYFSGVEILAMFKRGSQLAWAQVGSPSIFIQRENQRLQPLSVSADLSSELRTSAEALPPLPSQLLGLDRTCNIQAGHTFVREGDQIVLLAGTSVATSIWTLEPHEGSLNRITDRMIQEEPELPFWLGLIAV